MFLNYYSTLRVQWCLDFRILIININIIIFTLYISKKKLSLILCLNLFGFSSSLHSFGKWFQIFGPIYEALFSPIFVDFNGSLNLYLELRVLRGFSIKEYISAICQSILDSFPGILTPQYANL